MRWLDLEPLTPTEARARARVEARIERWWQAFAARTDDLEALFSRRAAWDLPAFMQRHLGAISPELGWDFGPGETVGRRGHRLTITCESEHHLRPLVGAVLARAPRLRGWTFLPRRPPESVEVALQKAQQLLGRRPRLGAAQVYRSTGACFEVAFQRPAGLSAEDAEREGAQLLSDLLGEELFYSRVMRVLSFRKLSAPVPLEGLRAAVEGQVAALVRKLPARRRPVDGAVLTLEPPRQRRYPGRSDLQVASTLEAPLWYATRMPPFFSARFSRRGETFAYLKIDGRQGLTGSRFGDREDIEEALSAALGRAGLGRVWGGGTGLVYSYVDLALTNLRRGARVVQQVLRRGQLPAPAWLLFFDAELADEWVAVGKGEGPPPQA